jgi:hypothetical protein
MHRARSPTTHVRRSVGDGESGFSRPMCGAPFDKGRLVAQRRAPKVPAGDLPDPVPFDRVRGLDASL